MCSSYDSTLADVIDSIPETCRWRLDKEIDFENTDATGRVIFKHIGTIASRMTDWEHLVADELGLDEQDKYDILGRNLRNPVLQRREALSVWRQRNGRRATYRALIEAFIKANHRDYAENVCKLINAGKGEETTDAPGTTSGGATAVTRVQGKEGGADSAVSTMTPDQLAKWLLQSYGASYQEDIDKLKSAKINGELFLDLAEDKELLDEVKLSMGFTKLIKKRIKQIKESASDVNSTPVTTGNGASVPPEAAESKVQIPLCASVDSDEEGQPPKISMRSLGALKTGSGEKINIIKQVAYRWKDFALQLDFDTIGTKVQLIDKKLHNDPEECCQEAMRAWLQGEGRQPATWELLVEILKDLDLNVLASQIEEATVLS